MDTNLEITADSMLDFARSVIDRDYNTAFAKCLSILHAFEVASDHLTATGDEEESREFLAIFASSFNSMLLDPELSLSRPGLGALITSKHVLRRIYSSLDYRDMGRLVPLLGEFKDGKVSLRGAAVDKYLCVCTLDSVDEGTYALIDKLDEEKRMLFILSLLDNKYLLRMDDAANVQRLADRLMTSEVVCVQSIAELDLLARIWFQCSYWEFSHKHQIKSYLNQVFRQTAVQQGAKDNERLELSAGNKRHKVLVVLEVWTHNSAMYRCWASAISKLKEKFEVMALVKEGRYDDRALEVFDNHELLDPMGATHKDIESINRFQPDIIYYPSLGMTMASIALAQFRLAPIQVVTMGHPATTLSEHIDYIVIDEDVFNDPDTVSEKVMLVSNTAVQFVKPEANYENVIGDLFDKNKVQIVVNSMNQKLTPGFLEFCTKVAAEAEGEVFFHFLCGATPLNLRWIKSIVEVLPAKCYPMLGYEEYLSTVKSCDLQLTPFPFGNTNGFVDAMLCALPTICMDGPEMHSHNDYALSERAGLPPICRAADLEEYLENTLELIRNAELRKEISDHLAKSKFENMLLQEEETGEFSEVLQWLCLHHNEVKASEKKVWSIADRDNLSKQ